MTEKELISQLQNLKTIQPDKAWAFSVKMQLLGQNQAAKEVVHASPFSGILNIIFRQKLAYAFLALMVVVAGGFDIINQAPPASISETTTALVQQDQQTAAVLEQAKTTFKSLAKEVVKNPAVAKEVALEVQKSGTLLYVSSDADLKAASDELYKTIDEQMIRDLASATLTEEQQIIFDQAVELYQAARYSDALEKILLIHH